MSGERVDPRAARYFVRYSGVGECARPQGPSAGGYPGAGRRHNRPGGTQRRGQVHAARGPVRRRRRPARYGPARREGRLRAPTRGPGAPRAGPDVPASAAFRRAHRPGAPDPAAAPGSGAVPPRERPPRPPPRAWSARLTGGFLQPDVAEDHEVDALLASLGLEHVAGTPAGALPLGLSRLGEIARAAATPPKVILPDEAFS